jgi:hypothetical protein
VGETAVLEAIDQRRNGGEDDDAKDLRGPEWEVFCAGDEALETDDFRLRSAGGRRLCVREGAEQVEHRLAAWNRRGAAAFAKQRQESRVATLVATCA